MFKLTNLLLNTLAFLFFFNSYAGSFYGSDASKKVKNASFVYTNATNGSIKFVKYKTPLDVPSFVGSEWLRQLHKTSKNDQFTQYEAKSDELGYVHYRYFQTYKGIRVESAVFYIHTFMGQVVSANGDYFPSIDLASVNPAISKEQAIIAAKRKVKNNGIWNDRVTEKPKLVVVKINEEYKLAFKVDVYASKPLSRYYVFIDAQSSEELYRLDRIHHADSRGTAVTRYNGIKTITTDSTAVNSFRLREYGRGNGIETFDLNESISYFTAVDFTDANNYWDVTTNDDDAAYDAHYGSEVTYDYFFNNFNRDSYNDSGAVIRSYIHYSSNYSNAFWDGSRMTYGDGDGVNYSPLTSIDVVGHEITHAVTQNTANLTYSYQSGALNESFSDIFGVAIDYYANPSSANFLMGEQFALNGDPFRSMKNPNRYGDPDTYLGTNWYTGSLDNGGVHTNSGVQNFWFYLLVEGGNGTNDNSDYYDVAGIGMEKAAEVSYRNLAVYLTPSSQYSDARTYAIQSAIDLYDTCSQEVRSVTDAWNAVGVGNSYSNAVIASFYSRETYSCTNPNTINFTNNSSNATSYKWYFGDGDSSTLAAPSHLYDSVGQFNVTLIVNGTSNCNLADTLVLNNYITIENNLSVKGASCSPGTSNPSTFQMGIYLVKVGAINHRTDSGGTAGYRDYTCSVNPAEIVEGKNIPVEIQTGPIYDEDVRIWIDFNNDSSFNAVGELVYSSDDASYHTGTLLVPQNAIKDTVIRMRVVSEYAPFTITNCSTLTYGQVEDYSVIIRQNTSPPIADFSATPNQINSNDSAHFTDLTQNIPTSWSWSFPGGTPSTSTAKNPSVSYSSTGTYDVTLIATNTYGNDTITKSNYISVVNSYTMCTDDSSNAVSGKLFDSGGKLGNYSNRENCSFLINPTCATSITLSFNSFSLESCCDYFRVYDGKNTAGALLLSVNGTSLPSSVTANSGSMFIQFTSDYSVVRSGWEADWSSTVVSTNIVADFNASTTNPILNYPVQFSDLTSNNPEGWAWDFGDGNSSFIQNPQHIYTSSGNYTVSLVSRSCASMDTISKSITVQKSGVAVVTPSSINDTVNCGDSIDVSVQIKNTGLGDMVYTVEQSLNSDTLEVLALQYGVDLFGEYPNTIDAINSSFNSYRLTELNTTDSSTLKTAAQGKDVILIPELENSISSVFTNLSSVLQNFVSDGGTVIFCGTGSFYADGIFNSGLFSGNYVNFINASLTSTNPNSPIHDSVSYPFNSPNATFTYNFTDSNIVDYITYLGNSVVASRDLGLGKVYMVGFDYYLNTPQSDRILGNIFRLVQNQSGQSSWIGTSAVIDTVASGDSASFTVQLNAKNLFAGTYYDTLTIYTTDSSNLEIELPIQYTVNGTASIGADTNSVEFPITQVNAIKSSPLIVYNYGCDTLTIDSIILSDSDFTIDSIFGTLPPFGSDTLDILFSPTTIKNYNDSLLIFSSDSILQVNLIAQSEGSPLLSYSPQQIRDTITNCGDSIVIPVSFYNSGQGALSLKLDATDNIGRNFSSENKVLLVRDFSSWGSNENFKVLDSMGVDITTIGSASFATTVLDSFNLIVFESNQSFTFYNRLQTYSTKLDTYLSNGGSVHMSITNQSNYNFPGGVLKTTSSPQFYDTNFVVNQSHPLHNGCTGPYLGNSASHYGLTNLPSGSTILAENSLNTPTAVEVKIGNGTMLAFGMTLEYMFYFNYNCTSLLRNSFEYLLSKSKIGSDWVSLSPDSLYIPINDSGLVNVTLKSNGLSNGVYESNVLIASNDPLRLFDTIPVTMVLIGSPLTVVSDTVVVFPSTTQYLSARDSILFKNDGCDTLRITNVLNTSTNFSTDTSEYSILPNDSSFIYFNFNPTSIGLLTDTFRFVNNGPAEIQISVSGISLSAPELRISDLVINDTISTCNDSIIRSIQIYNDGGNTLDWDFNLNASSFEDFESGLDASKWTVNGGFISQLCNTYSGLGAMYFNGNGQRSIASTTLDLTRSNEVEFYLKYANSSGSCENLDSGEEVILEYSTNNGITWTAIRTYSIFNHAGTFTFVSESLPTGAKTAQTLLRWRQLRSSGSCCDHWAIDDISLQSSGLFDDFVTDITPDSASTLSSDSTTVDITLNSLGLSSGVYSTKLYIYSNDPLNSLDSIIINMVVEGNAVAVLSDTVVTFPSTTQFSFARDSVLFENEGCDTLRITNVLNTSSEFSTDTLEYTIAPADSSFIYFNFNPTTTGSLSDTFRFVNNGPEIQVSVSGISLSAPEFRISDLVINDTIRSCNDSTYRSIKIYNDGGNSLDWKFNSISLNFEDFENGLDVSKWSVTGGFISQLCNTYSGLGAMYFNGNGQRSIASSNLDLTRSNEVEFYLKYANSSGSCETLDSGEEVILEYSTNNGIAWTPIRTYSILNHAGTFTFVSESLPAGAKTTQTLLRWRQRSSSGSSFDHWAIDDISLQSGGSLNDFVTDVSPDSASTPSSDSTIIEITLKSLGLSSGTYSTTLYINSNDPLNPNDSVTVNLVVEGTPEYVLSDSCIDFGSVLRNDTKIDSVQIINEGCEDLYITGTLLGNASYSLLSYPDTLQPQDTAVIYVEFNPTSVGNFDSYLRLFNNYIDTNICLKGESVPAPVIDLNPDSLFISANSCEDSIIVPFTIRNTGGSILNYEIQANKDSIKILALTYGVDYFGEFSNTKTALSNNLSNYSMTELYSVDSTIIKSALRGIDVVLIPELESGFSNNFRNYAPPLIEFVNNGGSVIFCGTFNSASLTNIGLFSGTYSRNASGRQASFTSTHPILDSVNSPFTMFGGSYGYSFTNSDAVTIVDYFGHDIVTYRDLGFRKGKVVYIAFDFISYSTDMAKILGNSFKWVSQGTLPNWIDVPNLQDSISGSDSNIVNVTIYPKGLTSGIYNTRLRILNNDPVNSDIELPITLEVVPDPCSDFAFSVSDICKGIVQFTDSSSNTPSTWSWDFGDSTTSTLQSPSHTYSKAGIYNVQLIVSNSFGSDTSSQIVTINRMIADFSVDSPLVLNRLLNFTSNSPGAISWNWDFGNGVKGTGSSLSYSYSTAGNYDVTLIATNGFNCKDTIVKSINIIAVGLENLEIGDFSLFPNPNEGKFNIHLPKNKFLSKVEIYSYNGQLVFEKDYDKADQRTKVELVNPVVGIYLVKVWTTADDFIEKKLLIKR